MGHVSFFSNPTSSSKCSLCFPIHFQHPSYGVKLYRVPDVAMAHLRSLSICAKAWSVVHDTELGSDLGSSSPLTQRSDPLLDRSNHSLNDADDFEKQLEELFDEVKSLISTGKITDAVDLLQANCHAVKEQLDAGFSGIEEAATLDIIALGYMGIGDLKMVGSLLDAMSKIVDSLDDDEMLLDSILVHMGSMYSAIENSQKSIFVYERALKIMDNVYGYTDWRLVPKEYKVRCMNEIKLRFSFPRCGEDHIQKALGRTVKDFIGELKATYYEPNKHNRTSLVNAKPPRVPRDQWLKLLSY
ncbi:hypothetical protein RND81_01G054700 [Saponaria officinalis]